VVVPVFSILRIAGGRNLTAKRDARVLTVFAVHLEPQADLVIRRHVRFQIRNVRTHRKGVVLQQPRRRKTPRDDRLHLTFHSRHPMIEPDEIYNVRPAMRVLFFHLCLLHIL